MLRAADVCEVEPALVRWVYSEAADVRWVDGKSGRCTVGRW